MPLRQTPLPLPHPQWEFLSWDINLSLLKGRAAGDEFDLFLFIHIVNVDSLKEDLVTDMMMHHDNDDDDDDDEV